MLPFLLQVSLFRGFSSNIPQETVYLNVIARQLEALECLSSSVSVTGDSNQRSVTDNVDSECLHEMLNAMLNETSSNWLSLDVDFQIDSHMRSDLSMQYTSKMLRRHPSWVDNDMTCLQEHMYTVSENQEYKLLLEVFQDELMTTIASFQLKFSLIPLHLYVLDLFVVLQPRFGVYRLPLVARLHK
ncbi:hypothetical protein K7X08_009602 [Anisodus acutangulus]|uniref:Uncharacterized protein n=1 Tax=Anisodus acutangulus TaxID=402998 RepID=A0A9Q1N430_9SOLA|nr:hypothetical protein K7X08_009602 [Anisodus acutangulus]